MIWKMKLRLDMASSPTTPTKRSEPYVRMISKTFINVPSGMNSKFALRMSSA